MTKKKKARYKSKDRHNMMLSKLYKNPSASFWADFTPRRDVGVFSNIHATFKHNGQTRFL